MSFEREIGLRTTPSPDPKTQLEALDSELPSRRGLPLTRLPLAGLRPPHSDQPMSSEYPRLYGIAADDR